MKDANFLTVPYKTKYAIRLALVTLNRVYEHMVSRIFSLLNSTSWNAFMESPLSFSCAIGLGDGLRQARRGRYSQKELAELVNTAQPRIAHLEAGNGSMTLFLSAVRVLGLDIAGRSLPPAEHLGIRFAVARNRQGLSRQGLAEKAGISETALTAMEKDVSRSYVRTVDLVARALSAGLKLVPSSQSEGFYVSGVAHSSSFQAWKTPEELLNKLYAVFGKGFDLDPCSPTKDRRTAPVNARRYFTILDNALELSWKAKTVFLNPPYGKELKSWVAKAYDEHRQGNAKTVVLLIPARPDTKIWHQCIAGTAYVIMLKGRLAFADETGIIAPAPFPSALAVYGASEENIEGFRREFPEAWHIPGTT